MSDRRRQIIDQAARPFGREGFDKVTIKKLAEDCSISEPALYRHFSSNEDVCFVVHNLVPGCLRRERLCAKFTFRNGIELTRGRPVVHFGRSLVVGEVPVDPEVSYDEIRLF
jgi:AraC-like DNA-binding protein